MTPRRADRTTIPRRRAAGSCPTRPATPPATLAALRWVGEQRAVRVDVLAHVLDPAEPYSPSRTRAVVRGWQRLGLVERHRVLAGTSPLVWPTRAGLAAAGLPYRAAPPPLMLLPHLHAVSLVRLGVERLGGTWTSERRLARARVSADDHLPDAVFQTARGLEIAVEVELTPKGAARLRRIVDELTVAYQHVVYVVGAPPVRTGVEQAVEALGSGRDVSVADLACFALPTARRGPHGTAT